MTYPATPCYLLEPTDRARVGLRRYRSSSALPTEDCRREGGKWRYHGATTWLADVPFEILDEKPDGCDHWMSAPDGRIRVPAFEWPAQDDPRWPTHCECGHPFDAGDAYQQFWDPLYRRVDTGELLLLRDAPPGAMWDADWYPWRGPDGRCLMVRCPNGNDWVIDGRASNCTLPDDTLHRCWVRHGDPPNVTVDKDGLTCAAGAGSILAGDYHGFLRNGELTAG